MRVHVLPDVLLIKNVVLLTVDNLKVAVWDVVTLRMHALSIVAMAIVKCLKITVLMTVDFLKVARRDASVLRKHAVLAVMQAQHLKIKNNSAHPRPYRSRSMEK